MATSSSYPAALPALVEQLDAGRRIAFLLDYDGTLAAGPPLPSSERFPAPGVVIALESLHAAGALLGIVTGRGEANLLAVLPAAARYTVASSHGLRVRAGDSCAPGCKGDVERHLDLVVGADELPTVQAAHAFAIKQLVAHGLAASVRINDEAHFFSFQVADCSAPDLAVVRSIAEDSVKATSATHRPASSLYVRELKGVIEVRPAAASRWDKGDAANHLLRCAGLADQPDVAVIAIGDDVSDEAMFAAVRRSGCGAALAVVVGTPHWKSSATHSVLDPSEVEALLTVAASRIVALGST